MTTCSYVYIICKFENHETINREFSLSLLRDLQSPQTTHSKQTKFNLSWGAISSIHYMIMWSAANIMNNIMANLLCSDLALSFIVAQCPALRFTVETRGGVRVGAKLDSGLDSWTGL